MNATLIILRMGGERGEDVRSPTNPYRLAFTVRRHHVRQQEPADAAGATLAAGAVDFLLPEMAGRARPESFGGRTDLHLSGRKSYDIHPPALDSDAPPSSYLLPMA
jgi:hypothetical protein